MLINSVRTFENGRQGPAKAVKGHQFSDLPWVYGLQYFLAGGGFIGVSG